MSAHCLFCGGRVLDGACELCGIRRLAVDEKRVGAPCPRCVDARLESVELGELVLQGCARCFGLFVATREWDAILDAPIAPTAAPIWLGPVGSAAAAVAARGDQPYRESIGPPPREVAPAPRAVDLQPPVRCVVCGALAERVEFGGLSRVVVDVCKLHGVWLDAGELAQVVARARENPTLPEPDARAKDREARAIEMVGESRREPSLPVLVLHAILRALRDAGIDFLSH